MKESYADAMFILVSAGLLLFVVGWVTSSYQKLKHYRNGAFQMWNVVASEIKHRHELLDRLIDWLDSCIPMDSFLLQDVVRENKGRFPFLIGEERLFDAMSVKQFRESEYVLQHALEDFFREINTHPELKNELPVSQLRHELALSSTKIHRALYVYNAAAGEYNTALESFPSSVVAQLFHMKRAVPMQNVERE